MCRFAKRSMNSLNDSACLVRLAVITGAQCLYSRLLRQAEKKGYRLKDLGENEAFSSLRSRADFKMLLVELDAMDRD